MKQDPSAEAFTVSIPQPITNRMLSGILCVAFEGGVGYWCRIQGYRYPEGTEPADFSDGGRLQTPGDYWHRCQLVPLYTGGAVILLDIEEGKTHRLDLAALLRGAQKMAEEYPKHFRDWVEENDDAITGDVFLQCCIFGEAVYG